mmetsp:Transcript_5688/g.14103  ORF Transcript_5688/g.14103 Transcript_5688/m.14103 type:complete len:106 (+) Transcript_5688:1522-1839(+)
MIFFAEPNHFALNSFVIHSVHHHHLLRKPKKTTFRTASSFNAFLASSTSLRCVSKANRYYFYSTTVEQGLHLARTHVTFLTKADNRTIRSSTPSPSLALIVMSLE